MMDESTRKSISSLLDDEADELALRRVMGHSDHEEVRALWGRYSKVSDMLSTNVNLSDQGQLNAFSIDVSQGVAQAIETDAFDESDSDDGTFDFEADDQNFGRVRSQVNPWTKKFKAGFSSRVAVAAAVVLTFSFAINDFSSDQDPQVAVTSPALTPIALDNHSQLQVAEKTFTPEHAARLNEYLLRHAENSLSGGRSGVMPLARVASFTITEN